jgi:hypothetical protein
VLVLLPPSEGKAAGGDGPPVGRRPVLSTPDLARGRSDLLDALRRAARTDPAALARGLRLPAGVAAAALAADARARTAPTMAALDRYTGVVYQALDVASLTPAARRRAEELVLVSSGLWGVVRGGDLVPDYRVPASGTVPGLGGVTAHWRVPLAGVAELAQLAERERADLLLGLHRQKHDHEIVYCIGNLHLRARQDGHRSGKWTDPVN